MLRSTSSVLVARFIVLGLGLISGVMIARALGPELKGVYTFLILVPSLLALMGDLGVGIANVYHIGQKRYPLPDIVWNSVILALGMGLVLSLVGATLLFTAKGSVTQLPWVAFIIVLGSLPFILMTSYLSMILLGVDQIRKYNFVNISTAALGVVGVSILLVVLGTGLVGALIAWFISIVVTGLLVSFLVQPYLSYPPKLNLHLVTDSIKFGLKGHLSNVLSYLTYRLDFLLLAYLSGAAAVGYYSVAVTLAESLWILPSAASTVLLPRVATMGEFQSKGLTSTICRSVLLLMIVVAVIAFVVVRPFIPMLFGQAYLPATQPFVLLLPGTVFLTISKITSTHLVGIGKPILGTYVAAATLPVNATLNMLLIPRFGATGAAVAASFSYGVSAILLLIIFARVTGTAVRDLVLVSRSDFPMYKRLVRSLLIGIASSGHIRGRF